MKKFVCGLLIGSILSFSSIALANNPINLIVNGQKINCGDTPPQIINGRTYVPAKFVAEPLGASVSWDGTTNSVKINNGQQPTINENIQINRDMSITSVKVYFNSGKNLNNYEKMFANGMIKVQYGSKYSNNYNLFVLADNVYEMFPSLKDKLKTELPQMQTFDYQGKKYVSTPTLGIFLKDNGIEYLMVSNKDEFIILTNDFIDKWIMG